MTINYIQTEIDLYDGGKVNHEKFKMLIMGEI